MICHQWISRLVGITSIINKYHTNIKVGNFCTYASSKNYCWSVLNQINFFEGLKIKHYLSIDDDKFPTSQTEPAYPCPQIGTWKNKSVGYLKTLTVQKAILSKKVDGAWCFFRSIDKSAWYASHGCICPHQKKKKNIDQSSWIYIIKRKSNRQENLHIDTKTMTLTINRFYILQTIRLYVINW